MSVEHIGSEDNQNSDQLFSFGQTETGHWILSIDQACLPVSFEVGSNLQYYLSLQSPDENALALEKRFKILMTDVDDKNCHQHATKNCQRPSPTWKHCLRFVYDQVVSLILLEQ